MSTEALRDEVEDRGRAQESCDVQSIVEEIDATSDLRPGESCHEDEIEQLLRKNQSSA